MATIMTPVTTNAQNQEPSQSKVVKKKVSKNGPVYVFKLYALEAMSNYWYQLDICDEDGSKVFPSVTIRNGVPLEGKPDGFAIQDVNGDGNDDIKILGGESKGKRWYKIWLYDVAKHSFEWSTKSS